MKLKPVKLPNFIYVPKGVETISKTINCSVDTVWATHHSFAAKHTIFHSTIHVALIHELELLIGDIDKFGSVSDFLLK